MEETGTDFKQHCPLTGGDHKYFISKTLELFEPVVVSETAAGLIKEFVAGAKLYVKKEYAILGCNCGSAVRKEIEKV